ncbi:MAG: hypothetical protein QOJ76_599 [Acidobacteriota bacterium]|nr:hypothetical protein [Acidobacteriota bacterium]
MLSAFQSPKPEAPTPACPFGLVRLMEFTVQATILKRILPAVSLLLFSLNVGAVVPATRWRAAGEQELRRLLPARAHVIKENIETEFRTASGATDGRGKFIAGVVMITAGYSAEGKYSHFFITQVPLRIGETDLRPGEYVLGYQRINNDSIRVSFYRAANGERVGEAEARVNRKSSRVVSLLIAPPISGKAYIQIGRFVFEYGVTE